MTYNEARREIRALMGDHIFTLSALEKRLGWNKDEIVFLLIEIGFDTTCVRLRNNGKPLKIWAKNDLIQVLRASREPLDVIGLKVLRD